ncbi:hypothetical protein ABPG74_007816 [Tetrahymena malaccensis]
MILPENKNSFIEVINSQTPNSQTVQSGFILQTQNSDSLEILPEVALKENQNIDIIIQFLKRVGLMVISLVFGVLYYQLGYKNNCSENEFLKRVSLLQSVILFNSSFLLFVECIDNIYKKKIIQSNKKVYFATRFLQFLLLVVSLVCAIILLICKQEDFYSISQLSLATILIICIFLSTVIAKVCPIVRDTIFAINELLSSFY